MDLGLKDKRALVSGSSRGLGYATALALAKEGCKVAINGRDAAKIQAVTGWTPTIPFEQTLQEILDDWRDRVRRAAGSPPDSELTE